MAISDKLRTLDEERALRSKVFEFRSLLQQARGEMQRVDAGIQSLADEGILNGIDSELGTVLQSGWDIVKQANAAFKGTDIAELLDWSVK